VIDVAVLGGYGGFGQRIVRALASGSDDASVRSPPCVAVAGRRLQQSEALCATLRLPNLVPIGVDVDRLDDLQRLLAFGPKVLIDAAGPFQGSNRALARACVAAGIHYIDLADDPAAVVGIVALDAEAKARDVLASSGASTVPALSCAVVDRLTAGMSGVESVEIGISPGHDGPRGLATVRSILSYVGRPIAQWRDGRASMAPGWGGTVQHVYPDPVGKRWLSRVDVPDTLLLPRLHPGLRNVEIRAGLEVPLAHHALRSMAWAVRHGLLAEPARFARIASRVASWLDAWGSDAGAMHVRVGGHGPDGGAVTRLWTVVARAGAGPEIPGTAAVLLARRLLAARGAPHGIPVRGAMPAVGLLSLHEFERAWQRLPISVSLVEEAGAVAL
jgi:saccharopine dehydrogenase-like NADP-dependent oxidoreductase